MGVFYFQNQYGRDLILTLGPERAEIRDVWNDQFVREYRFCYADITRYQIQPAAAGCYQLYFWSDGKRIEQREGEKLRLVGSFRITARAEVEPPARPGQRRFCDGPEEIRRVICRNTPLRSELDRMVEQAERIHRQYRETPEDGFATVLLTGFQVRRGLHRYCFDLNGVPCFTAYTAAEEAHLRSAGQWEEPPARPRWQDSRTLAFRLPYGRWRVGYSFRSRDVYGIRSNEGPKSVDVTADPQHRLIRLRTKAGLLGSRIVLLPAGEKDGK